MGPVQRWVRPHREGTEMAKCDLCGNNCKAIELVQLLDSYQTVGIVDICRCCEKWANKLKRDMLAEIAPRMRAAIEGRKGESPPEPRKSWWRRFMAGVGVVERVPSKPEPARRPRSNSELWESDPHNTAN